MAKKTRNRATANAADDAGHANTPASQDETLPQPVRAWRIAFLVICTVGICLSADLVRLHVRVHTDPDYHSYCAMSERVNCETVAENTASVFLQLPVAVWGIFGYVFMAGLCIWGLRRKQRSASWPFGALFWLSLFSSCVGFVLFAYSHYVIRSVCLVCGGTYLVNIGLLIAALVDLRRHGSGPIRGLVEEIRAFGAAATVPLLYGGAFAAAMAITWISVPAYWTVEATKGPGGLDVGHTAEGHPWIGAAQPKIEIVEFSDYQCPHCLRGHDDLRKAITQSPANVRLVHRHYPLDHQCNPIVKRPFHPQACLYARLAYCADRQGKFWEANDFVFNQGRRREPIGTDELAREIGLDAAQLSACVESAEATQAIEHDMAAGRTHKVRGTPTFVIGDRTYPGRIPADVLDQVLKGTPPKYIETPSR